MEIKRTIPIILSKNESVSETVTEFNRFQRNISQICFNEGKPLDSVKLHRLVYYKVPSTLFSQMKCSAIRVTAAAYIAAKHNHHKITRKFNFKSPSALFLFTKDFSFRRDGSMSISTINGRQRVSWKIPKRFQADFDSAKKINCLRITRRQAFLCLTLDAPDPKGIVPVGIDLGINNALVASDAQGKTLFISGKALSVRNTRIRKTRSRLQSKLSEKKAQHRDTKSVRRVLQRLSQKISDRNRTFCQETAARLCKWAPSDAVLVFEDLIYKPKTKKEHIRKGTRRKLNGWFFSKMMTAIKNRAEKDGISLAYVDPAFTSQLCSRCGLLGIRKGHKFSCICGYSDHADINASKNILSRFTVLRSSGLLSTSPETLKSVQGEPPSKDGSS